MQFQFIDPADNVLYQIYISELQKDQYVIELDISFNNKEISYEYGAYYKGEIHWYAQGRVLSAFVCDKIDKTVKKYVNNLAFV